MRMNFHGGMASYGTQILGTLGAGVISSPTVAAAGRTGYTRMTGAAGASCNCSSGIPPAGVSFPVWTPGLPAFIKAKFALQDVDHVAFLQMYDRNGTGALMGLKRDAANLLYLENFVGATQNFAAVLVANTIYTATLILTATLLRVELATATGAPIETQQLTYSTVGTRAAELYARVTGTGGASRYMDLRIEHFAALVED